MKRKGDIIFWTVEGIEVGKDKLEDLGLGLDRFIPRNDFKAAMIKSLKETFKGNERMYKRYNDRRGEVSFGVFIESTDNADIDISKEFQFKLDKYSGELSMLTEGETPAVVTEILENFKHGKKHLDSTQFTTTIKRFIKSKGFAVSMKPKGGLYFLDDRFKEVKEQVKSIFDVVAGARFHAVAIGTDDKEGLNTLEEATSTDVFNEIEKLKTDIEKGFSEGTITRLQVQGKKEAIEKTLKKINVHADSLRTQADVLRIKASSVAKALVSVTSKVEANLIEPGDFQAALAAI
jgi:hypothetical protein